MKFGLSFDITHIELLSEAVQAGFDYVETSVKLIASLSEAEFAAVSESVKRLPIPVATGCCLFPPEIKLVGPDRNFGEITTYLEHAFTRISSLGITTVVLGSGGSRRIPEGYVKNVALKDFAEVCQTCIAGVAKKLGLTVVIEPLNGNETDLINTVSDSVDFYRTLNLPEFGLLCDGFHMKANGEDYAEIEKCGKALRLMHIANPDGRMIPKSADGDIYEGYFRALRNIGYDGCVTCEGGVPRDNEHGTRLEKLKDTVAFLRKQ